MTSLSSRRGNTRPSAVAQVHCLLRVCRPQRNRQHTKRQHFFLLHKLHAAMHQNATQHATSHTRTRSAAYACKAQQRTAPNGFPPKRQPPKRRCSHEKHRALGPPGGLSPRHHRAAAMAPKHALPAASKPVKRRRRQASVRSFFTPRNPSPPSCPPSSPDHPAPAQSQPLSIPSPPSLPTPPLSPFPPPSVLQHVALSGGLNVHPSPVSLASVSFSGVDLPPKPDKHAQPNRSLPTHVRCLSSDESPPPVSRLSRRRSNRLKPSKRAVPTPTTQSCLPVTPAASHESLPKPTATAHTRPAKKKLHPFFAATAAAVNSAKERAKSQKPQLPLVDAWEAPSSTIHVNYIPPANAFDFHALSAVTQSPHRAGSASCSSRDLHKPARPVFTYASLSAVTSSPVQNDGQLQLVNHHPLKNTNIWAEHYKNDSRIDVINGTAIKRLVDWLRDWYETPQDSQTFSDNESFNSFMTDTAQEKERVAIITGATGCGKSTIVATAARQVGLSVLEINASTCRTGKRIREVIGDALSTHRVAHTRNPFSGRNASKTGQQREVPQAKTLVVFEEVDILNDDEKGFWTTFQKLASADNCRRPIICTATAFNSHMRQVFAEVKRPVEADLERIFINAKADQPLNAPLLPYKHIHLPERTERQSVALLSRISSSESVQAIIDMKQGLALLCHNDTRRAVNLLHFWGSKGLRSAEIANMKAESHDRYVTKAIVEAQNRIGLDVVRAIVQDFAASSIFRVGSKNYSIRQEPQQPPCAAGSNSSDDVITSDEQYMTLEAWSASLEALSTADFVRGATERQKVDRNAALSLSSHDICMHADLESILVEAEELDVQAIYYSRKHLRFESGVHQLHDISCEARTGPDSLQYQLPSRLPYTRRPVMTEYMPMLRIMAVEHEKQSRDKPGKRGQDRCTRRTRSRSRKDGFSALDLDPETVSALKKTSIQRETTKQLSKASP